MVAGGSDGSGNGTRGSAEALELADGAAGFSAVARSGLGGSAGFASACFAAGVCAFSAAGAGSLATTAGGGASDLAGCAVFLRGRPFWAKSAEKLFFSREGRTATLPRTPQSP